MWDQTSTWSDPGMHVQACAHNQACTVDHASTVTPYADPMRSGQSCTTPPVTRLEGWDATGLNEI